MAYSMPVAPTNLDAFSSIISGGRRPRGEITIEARAAIIAAVQAGDKRRLIAKRYGVSVAAIHRTLHRFEKTGQLASRPRSGRPRTRANRTDALKPKTGPRPAQGVGFRRVWGPQPGAQPAASAAPGPAAPSPGFDTPPSTMLANLNATLHPTTYVFASFRNPAELPPMPQIQLFFQEPNGITIVTSLGYARAHRLECFFPCRMISVNFTASAEVAGHTAVLVARLAARNLGVKSVSGFYCDHLFVPEGRETEAMEVLAAVAEENRRKFAGAAPVMDARPAVRQTEEAQPEESQRDDGQHGQNQSREARPTADTLRAEDTAAGEEELEAEHNWDGEDEGEDEQKEEEEDDEFGYGLNPNFEAHQCSEVDSQFEDPLKEDTSEGSTSGDDQAKD